MLLSASPQTTYVSLVAISPIDLSTANITTLASIEFVGVLRFAEFQNDSGFRPCVFLIIDFAEVF